MRGIALLGSTGSIGTQALDIVRLFPDKLKVCALAANRNVDLLVKQAEEFLPECVAIGDANAYHEVKQRLSSHSIEVLVGEEGLKSIAVRPSIHTIVAAVVGFAGFSSVIEGIRAGKEIALANKETLVAGGMLINELLETHDGTMIPIDSEHSAIFQCLVGERERRVEKITLTASGGPFRKRAKDSFSTITKKEALAHPNWSMGAKISIDSATMMNKGLEVIEARWLFDVTAEKIEVLVHPQSIIHSLVTFTDGSTKAQLGEPDMHVPIQYALSYPDRWPAPHPRLDWRKIPELQFESPDFDKFPCLQLAFDALRQGGTAPAVLNAANEAAVSLFLKDGIRFVDIPVVIEGAISKFASTTYPSMDRLVTLHKQVQHHVLELYGAPIN